MVVSEVRASLFLSLLLAGFSIAGIEIYWILLVSKRDFRNLIREIFKKIYLFTNDYVHS